MRLPRHKIEKDWEQQSIKCVWNEKKMLEKENGGCRAGVYTTSLVLIFLTLYLHIYHSCLGYHGTNTKKHISVRNFKVLFTNCCLCLQIEIGLVWRGDGIKPRPRCCNLMCVCLWGLTEKVWNVFFCETWILRAQLHGIKVEWSEELNIGLRFSDT